MTSILLRIAGTSFCFAVSVLGVILAWHGYKLNADFIIIFSCLICTFFGMVGMIKLTTRTNTWLKHYKSFGKYRLNYE